MSPLVRAASLTNYKEVACSVGLDPDHMLRSAGLNPSVLHEPDLMIPGECVGRLLHMSASRADIESFGLRMAEHRFLSNLGAVGLLIRDQPTLRDSLHVLMRYQALLNGSLSLALEEYDDLAILREAGIVGKTQNYTRQRVELALGVMVRMIRQLVGPHWHPKKVCFEHSAPKDPGTHIRFFGKNIEFNADLNCIVCTQKDLDTPNHSADPAMVRYAQQLLDQTITPHHTTTIDEVRRTVMLLLPSGRCSVEQVAAHLGVVPRTVQRRLAENGHSFSAIVNDIRKELAQRYVRESERPMTEIAALLGFSALSVFSRWYQSQFGCSAKSHRATEHTQ